MHLDYFIEYPNMVSMNICLTMKENYEYQEKALVLTPCKERACWLSHFLLLFCFPDRFISGIQSPHTTYSISFPTFCYFHQVCSTILNNYKTDFGFLLKTLSLPFTRLRWDFTVLRAEEMKQKTLCKKIKFISQQQRCLDA